MSNWNSNFSHAATHSRPSPVREILAVIKKPGMISFAGGMPAPEVFPVDEFYEGAHLLKDKGSELLQYGTTDGNPLLRECLADFMAERLGRKVDISEIMLTTGSQQALDLFAWAMLDPGDIVITEDPSYMAAINVFTNHGGVCRGVHCDADGILTDEIPGLIESLRAEGKKVKCIYTIVNFQNPGGMTMSVERRNLLAAYGAELVLTPGAEGMKGAIAKAEELRDNTPNAVILGQFTNPANPAIHYTTTGQEIWDDTAGQVDVFIGGVGRALKEKNMLVEIIAVEPASSPMLSEGKAGPHKIQGIGANFVPETYQAGYIDRVMTVTNEDAFAAARSLAKDHGLLVGISSGAAYSAALQLSQQPDYQGKNIVVLLPDTGERYLSVL